MIKLVVFDLDGTLTDSLASIQYCANGALEACGLEGFSADRYRYFVGDGMPELIKRCTEAAGDKDQVHFEKALEVYKTLFQEYCMYQVVPYDGILELLEELKNRQIKIAVNSNKPHDRAVEVVEQIFGKGYFDLVIGQSEERPKKPSPEGVFYILEKLGVKSEEVLYLGDTDTDMQTGKQAFAFTVGVLWGFREREELEQNQADAIITHPLEALNYL